MPNTNSQVVFRSGTAAGFAAIATKDSNTIYFCTDTKQLFVGDAEYTKGTAVLQSAPTKTTVGDDGRLYAYNGNLYLCKYVDGTTYDWIRVANVNDKQGSVVSVGAGEGLSTAAGSDNPITNAGTIVHAVPEGAEAHADGITNQTAKFGQTVQIESVETDKFGHVVAVNIHTITLPQETAVSVAEETITEQTELGYGDTFQVVSQVEKGDGSHEVKSVVKEFKMPEAPTAQVEGFSTSYDPETNTVTIS